MDADIETLNDLLDQEFVTAVKVENVNFDPHPYVIGPLHIEKNVGMVINGGSIRAVEKVVGRGCCYHRQCTSTFDEHTFDRALFVKLNKDVSRRQLSEQLLVVREASINLGIDGFAVLTGDYKIITKGD